MSNAVDAPQPAHRGLIILAVMSAAVLVVLDMTIVNVAMPHMAGALGASQEEISWVLTSYLIASAVLMPLTGFLVDRFGQRRVLLVSIAGFVLASAACGLAQNLPMMLAFRTLQGAFGASLVPLSQAILTATTPAEQRGRAMALWGMGVMLGPVLGPTLGGWLTETFDWRWIFYINLPVGVMAWLVGACAVPESVRLPRVLDWRGAALAALAIAALQFALDRGNLDGWLGSPLIVGCFVLSAVSFVAFLVYALTTRRHPVINLRLFTDRNFAAASAIIGVLGLGMFGALAVQPIMLETLLDYPTLTAGWTMAPRGLASFVAMLAAGRLIGRVDTRWLIGSGMVLAAAGSYFMARLTLDISPWAAIWPGLLQGGGMGLMMVPLSALALSTLAPAQQAEAAGVFSLVRTLGSSVGIAVVASVVSHQTQVMWHQFGAHVTPYNPALGSWLGPLHAAPHDPAALAVVAAGLARQASMQAVLDAYQLIAWSFLAMLPLLAVLQSGRKPVPATAMEGA